MRVGMQPGSEFHLTEYFGPVLGIMTADTLEDAIALVNRIDYGLTSGLHSLDSGEIHTWLATVEAGNTYVNRGMTGAIVQRHPFGGWKKSVVGPGAKAGGPNYLFGFGRWEDAAPVVDKERNAFAHTALAAVPAARRAWLAAALATDAAAFACEFGTARDAAGLESEQNVLRCLPLPVTVRAEEADPTDLVRVVAAGACAGADIIVSNAAPLSHRACMARRGRCVGARRRS